MMSRRKGQVEALGVNIHEAQENQLSSILKQRQAPMHITTSKDFTL
jgi:hypothetical protein